MLYVDDFLVAASLSNITDHTDLLIDTLNDLGLCINYNKSETNASQVIVYLWYTIDNRAEFTVI